MKERIGARSLIGLLLALVGILLIEQVFTASSGLNVGDFLVLGGSLCAAIYTILAVKVTATAESLSMTAYQFGFGALFSLPFVVAQWLTGRERLPINVDLKYWLVAVLIGGIGLAGSFLLYNYVIKFVSAGLAGVTVNLVPLFGVLTAIIFLDEHLTVWHIAGGVAVIAGVMLFPAKKHDESEQDADDDRKDDQLASDAGGQPTVEH